MVKQTKAITAPAFVVVNGQQVDVSVHDVSLDKLIDEMVQATQSEYGSHIRIAAKLNDMFAFAWYDIAAEDKGADAALFLPIWKDVYTGLRKAGHSNPSVAGKRIRNYGRNIRAGLAPNGKALADGSPLPEGEGDTGEGANPAKRSDRLYAIEESVKLWKRTHKSKDAELVAFATDLAKMMKAHLKVDVATIKA